MWRLFSFLQDAHRLTHASIVSGVPVSAPGYSQFASVSLSMSPAAKEKALDNLKSKQGELLSHGQTRAGSRSLPGAPGAAQLPRLVVVVRNTRSRSNFSAIMWGFMAGSDSFEGDIVLTRPYRNAERPGGTCEKGEPGSPFLLLER